MSDPQSSTAQSSTAQSSTALSTIAPPALRAMSIPARLTALSRQPAVARALPAIAGIALLGGAAMVWSVLSAAPGRMIAAGASDADKAAMADALTAANLPYSIDRDSGAITVADGSYHQARMLLAAQGLPRSADDGADTLASLPMGASRAVEGERIRSGREADLARTIEGIDVVESARVHIAASTPSVFVRDAADAQASVLLTLRAGRNLSDQQVQAVRHLVSASVPDLSADHVSIIDQNGQLLSKPADPAAAAQERQLAVQRAVEDRSRAQIAALLTPVLGDGNFTAEVHADMDFSAVQSAREGYPQGSTVLQSEQSQSSSDGGGGGGGPAGGIPGALSNQPPAATTVAAAPGGQLTPAAPGAPSGQPPGGGRRSDTISRSFAIGREISVTQSQSPTLRRLSVAVAVRQPAGAKPRTAAEIAALDQLVKGAVGFDAARGDVVAIRARPFAAETIAVTAWWEAPWVALVGRNLSALAIAALLLFGLARPLFKWLAARRTAAGDAPARAGLSHDLAAGLADHALADPATRITVEMIEASRDYDARAALIRGFVRQDPARAALVVRDLIRSEPQKVDDDA